MKCITSAVLALTLSASAVFAQGEGITPTAPAQAATFAGETVTIGAQTFIAVLAGAVLVWAIASGGESGSSTTGTN